MCFIEEKWDFRVRVSTDQKALWVHSKTKQFTSHPKETSLSKSSSSGATESFPGPHCSLPPAGSPLFASTEDAVPKQALDQFTDSSFQQDEGKDNKRKFYLMSSKVGTQSHLREKHFV